MSSGRSASPGQRFVPRVEGLEDRTVPSGNVSVTIVKGVLTVTGDDAANQIWIAGAGKNSVVVRSLDGTTTINGSPLPVMIGGVKHGYNINMNGGDDYLLVTGTRSNGSLTVNMGDGNDYLGIVDAGHRGSTNLFGGAGDDTIVLNGSAFKQYVYIDAGAGDDAVTTIRVAAGDFGLRGGGGNDFFNNIGSTFARPVFIGVAPGTRPATPDTTAPVPTLTSTSSDPTNAPINYIATFNEDVGQFSASGVTVANGTVTSFSQVDARTYTFVVTPTNQGVVTATVAAGAAFDAAGNASVGSATVSRTFDTGAPTVTVNALTTSSTNPTITGTVDDPTATVKVTVNGQTYTATVSGTSWSALVSSALGDGTYDLSVTATDPAGNTGSATRTGGLVVDTTVPAAPTLNLTAATDSGATGDLRTDQSTVSLTGSAEAGSTVTLYSTTVPNAPGTGAVIATTTAAQNGTFTFNNVALALGPNSFVVRSVDAAGNTGPTFAQTFTRNAPPTVATPIGPQVATVGTDTTVDVSNTFADAERVVRFTVNYPNGQTGFIDINLFANTAPGTVANFITYLNSADPTQNYSGTIFHRLVSNFVLQGGGFYFNNTTKTFTPVTKNAAIANEPGISNTLGTIAMAKGTGANSAQSEFFFNLGDNSSNLDTQNGGFTVFGQVMNGGLLTLNTIASSSSITTYSGSGIPGAAPFPVSATANTTNFPQNITTTDLVNLTTATELIGAQKLVFSVVSSDTSIATASVSGTTLTVHPVAAGTATITVRATDLDGSFTETPFVVTVS